MFPTDRCRVSLLAVALLFGCGDSGDDTIDFETGEFTVRTNVVDDQCLDGGLNLLFMPDGVDTPWEWPFPITIYSEDELPITYDIELRQPFGQMTVTAEDAGANAQKLVTEQNDAVMLGEAQFGECVADLTGTVQLTIEESDRASGFAELTLSDPRGDQRCPAEMPAECQVTLSFEAGRR